MSCYKDTCYVSDLVWSFLVLIFIRLDLSFVVGFQLAGANRPIALANANAILRRVELVCEVHTMSFFFGAILFDHCMLLCVLLLILVALSLFVFCR